MASSEGHIENLNSRKRLRCGLALAAIILGAPFVYLALILVVLHDPDIMTRLGLEPFVRYLIRLQLEGYANLVRLNSVEFAEYFFRFHAASLLIFGFFAAVTLVCAPVMLKCHPNPKEVIDNHLHNNNIKIGRLFFYGLALLILPGIFQFNLPLIADGKSKFSVTGGGMGAFVFNWVVSMIVLLGSIFGLYMIISMYYWPKLKSWLIGKQRSDHQT